MNTSQPIRYVATPTNRQTYEAIDEAIKTPGIYATLFVYGKPATGKTTLANGYGTRQNLLTSRKTMVTHPSMLALMLTSLFERSQTALDDLAEADTLIIDSLDDMLSEDNGQIAPEAILRLVSARCKARLSTIIFARHPIEAYRGTQIWPAIQGMHQLCLEPLDLNGRIELFRQIQDCETTSNPHPRTFSEDALLFLAQTFADDLCYGVKGAIATLHSSSYPTGCQITEEMIRLANA